MALSPEGAWDGVLWRGGLGEQLSTKTKASRMEIKSSRIEGMTCLVQSADESMNHGASTRNAICNSGDVGDSQPERDTLSNGTCHDDGNCRW
jgi:hypothetical protein